MPPKTPKPLATQPTTLNLPPFREDQPAMWFTLAEGQFEMKGMQDRRHWFYTVLAALSAQQQDRVADIAGVSPVPADAYQQVKERLLQMHELDRNQRIDKLLEMPSLQGQKPSDMLAKMRQLCPAGEETTALFRWMFLRRLPDKVKLMLAEDHSSSVTELAARADILTASAPKPAATIAAAAEKEDVIAAATAQPNRGRGRGNFERGHNHRGRFQYGKRKRSADRTDRAGNQSHNATGASVWEKAGICYYHWIYGKASHQCRKPCIWTEN